MALHFFQQLRRNLRLAAFALILAPSFAFGLQANPAASAAEGGHGRILLVLPFDNNSGQPSLEWIREAAPQILSSRFLSAGFAPLSRADRLYALDHLGLPAGFQPSHASSLKIAQTLDADSIIVGSFKIDGNRIEAEAKIISVPRLKMSAPVMAGGELRDLIAVLDVLAWKLTRQLDPGFSGAQETFVAAGANVHLEAFEQYIRGITEPDQDERLRHLQQAVKLNPDFSEAWMALARADYAAQRYEDAAAAFNKVKRNDPNALEAGFYRGLALLFSGEYAKAETAFAAVARVLPLAPVLNNQGVAVSRQGHDGTALFRQAAGADPASPDYHFNLAVSLKRHGDTAAPQAELTQYLKLRPNDTEAQQLLAAWKDPSSASSVEPLERIVRGFDAVAFRQAAVMMDQMEETRLAALTPEQRALTLSTQAREYLSRGLLLESERLYQQAIAADGRSEKAHEGLAEVRERTGDAAGARKEAQAALELKPSADAYLVLARLDLAANQLDQAGHNADEALKLSPNSLAAREVLRQLSAKQGATKQQAP
ncbi:MAG TPA: tetratricopeptide repeat protein [Terracidiphilus sp.]